MIGKKRQIKKIKRKISNDNETLNEIKQEEKKDNNINTVINYLLFHNICYIFK